MLNKVLVLATVKSRI